MNHFVPSNSKFDQNVQSFEKVQKFEPSQEMSLFVDNLIFEEQNTNESEEQYEQDPSNQIENNLLNLIDDEPEASQSFEKDDTQSLGKS